MLRKRTYINRSILKSSTNTKSYQNGSKIYNIETRDFVSKFDDSSTRNIKLIAKRERCPSQLGKSQQNLSWETSPGREDSIREYVSARPIIAPAILWNTENCRIKHSSHVLFSIESHPRSLHSQDSTARKA